jgi:DNA-binding NarL/FixJ family response regulator
VRTALAAGAAGVVLLDELDTALWPCLQAVQSGQTCVPRGHWRQIEPPALSAREKQILALVVMGYMNSQIAAQLFLAESTVKSHLSSAFGKLGVRSRNEAASLILDPERGLGMGILGLEGETVEFRPLAS